MLFEADTFAKERKVRLVFPITSELNVNAVEVFEASVETVELLMLTL